MVPGLELGAMGAAMQMVFNQFLNVNLKMFWIDKSNGWKFDWQFQFIGLGVGLTLAWLAYFISGSVSDTLSLNTIKVSERVHEEVSSLSRVQVETKQEEMRFTEEGTLII